MEKTIFIPWTHEEGKLVVSKCKTIWNKEFYRNTIETDERIKELLSTSWLVSLYPKDMVVDAIVLSSADPKTALTKVKSISYKGIEVMPDLFKRWDTVEHLLPDKLYAGPVYTIGRDTIGRETFRMLNIYLAYRDENNNWKYV